MVDLMAPLDSPQQTLLNVVWPLFSEHQKFPVYSHVEYRMRKLGLDAAEVLASLPALRYSPTGRYRSIDFTSGGGLPQPDSRVYLTMAGLFHARDHHAMQIIGANLAFLRAMSRARDEIAKRPFDVPDVKVDLRSTLSAEGLDNQVISWAIAVAEHEWPGMSVQREPDQYNASGRLGLLAEAPFNTVEEYLNAITAATTPQRPTTILQNHDPNALARALTNFDITCELVLGSPLIKKPAITRTALFVQDAATHSDLQAGVSALGEILSDLQVPGKQPPPSGRLLGYLTTQLPNIDQARVQSAIDVMDAVREIRNSGSHPRPSQKLIAAHEHLGLPFPVHDPLEAWRIVRAQMEAAFTTLQEEIYAAKP